MNIHDLERYSYHLPLGLIARRPLRSRDTSQLFVYDTATDTVEFDVFHHISRYMPEHSLLVLNETKVVPARLTVKKPTGGKVIVLLLVNEWDGRGPLKALVDRKVIVGETLCADSKHTFRVVHQEGKIFFLKPNVSPSALMAFLARVGTTPIPKYLAGGGLTERALRDRYQSVFARKAASVAAPTASLHFTQRVFMSLERRHVATARITLHVGMGTFAPFDEKNLRTKKLFQEYYEISQDTVRRITSHKKRGHPVIAVGTTATRALESAARRGILRAGRGETDLFIYPPYRFKVIDGLITNFHLPRSSLMLLVDAFLRYRHARRTLPDLYKIAVRNKFRFYSFGDAMLIR